MRHVYTYIIGSIIGFMTLILYVSDIDLKASIRTTSIQNQSINSNFRDECETQCTKFTVKNEKPEHSFRMGPVLLKFDKEWIIERNRKKYVRIGIDKRDQQSSALYQQYDKISPKSLATSTKSIEIESEQNTKKIRYSIDSYDIECDENQLWIDLCHIIGTDYDDSDKEIDLYLRTGKDVFFYNPTTKKWWGRPYGNMQDIEILLFTDLYDTKKSDEDLKKLYSRKVILAKEFIPNIINNRNLILPSTHYYLKRLRVLQVSCTFYDMYVEKEEIAPKDEDE